jgi:hypothetical protein
MLPSCPAIFLGDEFHSQENTTSWKFNKQINEERCDHDQDAPTLLDLYQSVAETG